MGGNVGVQSSAIVVQSLARGDQNISGMMSKIWKETMVGMVNGILLSLIILGIATVFGGFNLGLVVSVSLFTVILVAAIFGTLIPLVLDKYEIDPALATGPFITTLNDVVGLFIYFSIGLFIFSDWFVNIQKSSAIHILVSNSLYPTPPQYKIYQN